MLLKNYSVVGVHWAAYNLHDPALIVATHAELVRLHGEGSIRPFIGRRVPMAERPRPSPTSAGDGRSARW